MLNDPFDHHGISHLSASSLALYRNEPSLWCLRYLFGLKDESNAAMWRGTAVEAGVDKILYESCKDEIAIETALHTFEMNAQGDLSEDVAKERAAIPEMVKQAANMFRPLGIPVARQMKIEYRLEGIEIPIIGYVDYLWPEFLHDLKTTHRLPSEARPDHVAQVAGYAAATKRRGWLTYVTTKKGAAFPVDDVTEALWAINCTARAIRSMLSRATTKEEAASFFAPNFDNFYWNDKSKASAMELLR